MSAYLNSFFYCLCQNKSSLMLDLTNDTAILTTYDVINVDSLHTVKV